MEQSRPIPVPPTSTLIYIDGQSVLTLDGAVLQNNKALWGGAIQCSSNSTNAFNQIILRGTAAIRDNEADTGGGICFDYSVGSNSLVMYDQAVIENNRAI